MRLSAPLVFVLPLLFAPHLARSQARSIPDRQEALPDAPSFREADPGADAENDVSSWVFLAETTPFTFYPAGYSADDAQQERDSAARREARQSDHPANPRMTGQVDANGNPIPLDQQQPKRILGFMPNFRSVSGGAVPPPPSFKYNFKIATRQAFDYSSFLFLGITSLSAEGLNSHPSLGKGADGFYAYTWRGFLDKTDGTYLQAWLLPSLLHEDTRYYALGHGSIVKRSLYVISRQGVTRTYGGRQTPNIAGLGGKVLTQVISRTYYPAGASSFGVLATKFGYAAMRDIAFSSIREFYPQIAAHYIRKHREKMAMIAASQP